jgi:hypothetical protein
MTSEQANLQDKKVEALQAIYRKLYLQGKQAEALQAMHRKVSIDFVANKQKIDKEDLMLMRWFVVIFTLFLLAVLSGWTGFCN